MKTTTKSTPLYDIEVWRMNPEWKGRNPEIIASGCHAEQAISHAEAAIAALRFLEFYEVGREPWVVTLQNDTGLRCKIKIVYRLVN